MTAEHFTFAEGGRIAGIVRLLRSGRVTAAKIGINVHAKSLSDLGKPRLPCLYHCVI